MRGLRPAWPEALKRAVENVREMNRTDIAYLVNSTPKYYYILPLHFALLRRYAPSLAWPLYLATEEPDHPIVARVRDEFGVQILRLSPADAGFLDSRRAALEVISEPYVLLAQEDFLLDRAPYSDWLNEAIGLLEAGAASARLMPCPGPASALASTGWADLGNADSYMFTFQATLWERAAALTWYTAIAAESRRRGAHMTVAEKQTLETRINLAENADGQALFRKVLGHRVHKAFIRRARIPNGVYLSPWPYRPTAIVKGRLEPWAAELGQREGYPLKP